MKPQTFQQRHGTPSTDSHQSTFLLHTEFKPMCDRQFLCPTFSFVYLCEGLHSCTVYRIFVLVLYNDFMHEFNLDCRRPNIVPHLQGVLTKFVTLVKIKERSLFVPRSVAPHKTSLHLLYYAVFTWNFSQERENGACA